MGYKAKLLMGVCASAMSIATLNTMARSAQQSATNAGTALLALAQVSPSALAAHPVGRAQEQQPAAQCMSGRTSDAGADGLPVVPIKCDVPPTTVPTIPPVVTPPVVTP